MVARLGSNHRMRITFRWRTILDRHRPVGGGESKTTKQKTPLCDDPNLVSPYLFIGFEESPSLWYAELSRS